MKTKTHAVVQLALTGVQFLNVLTPSLSPKGQTVATGVLSITQMLVGLFNHYFNPDGSAAEAAWVKK